MPLFEYRCKKCGHINEVLVFGSEKPELVCEKCGSKKLEKIMSSFNARVNDSFGSSGTPTCPTGTCSLS